MIIYIFILNYFLVVIPSFLNEDYNQQLYPYYHQPNQPIPLHNNNNQNNNAQNKLNDVKLETNIKQS